MQVEEVSRIFNTIRALEPAEANKELESFP
jgi:hypothetical protein